MLAKLSSLWLNYKVLIMAARACGDEVMTTVGDSIQESATTVETWWIIAASQVKCAREEHKLVQRGG